MTRIRVLDFEATGDTPDEDKHGLCEIAYHDVVATGFDLSEAPAKWEVVEGRSRLCNPGVKITPETSAIHHILDEDVANEPSWKAILRSLVGMTVWDAEKEAVTDVVAWGAHGAEFEQLWIHPDWYGHDLKPLPFLDTYKAALRVWEDAPAFSNMALRYWLAPIGLERAKALPAHRAGPDAYATAFTLRELLNNGCTIEQLLEWSSLPALTIRCYLGDYRNGGKGTKWPDVPTSMLQWILDKGFEDKPDIRYTAGVHLQRRIDEDRAEREREDLDRQMRANGLPVGADAGNPLQQPAPPDPNQGQLSL